MYGIEDINDNKSLFRKLLDKWNTSQIKEIIRFFWRQKRDYEKKEQPSENEKRIKMEDKIINFWRWVYKNKYKGKQENELNGDDKKILSELCDLTVFLPEINSENFEWLKISALFVEIGFHSSSFINYLDKLKDKNQSVDFVGKVYLEMLKNTTPVFLAENIESIVEFLYQRDKKAEANEICNTYGKRGYDFLRELYDKYNS